MSLIHQNSASFWSPPQQQATAAAATAKAQPQQTNVCAAGDSASVSVASFRSPPPSAADQLSDRDWCIPSSSCLAIRHAVVQLFNDDDFDRVEFLGDGFFSDVYKVVHRHTCDTYVLKIYKNEPSTSYSTGRNQDESAETSDSKQQSNRRLAHKRNILREFQLINRFSHQNVLRFLGASERSDSWSIHSLTEFCDLGNLQRLIMDERRAFGWRLRCALAADVARGLEYVHAHGYIHRDLTSMNVLLKRSGSGHVRAVVADFGLACRRPDSADEPLLPQVGTPYWMAPECLNEEHYDEKVDIFSFGVIVCQCIARIDADPECGFPRTAKFGLDYQLFAESLVPEHTPDDLLRLAFHLGGAQYWKREKPTDPLISAFRVLAAVLSTAIASTSMTNGVMIASVFMFCGTMQLCVSWSRSVIMDWLRVGKKDCFYVLQRFSTFVSAVRFPSRLLQLIVHVQHQQQHRSKHMMNKNRRNRQRTAPLPTTPANRPSSDLSSPTRMNEEAQKYAIEMQPLKDNNKPTINFLMKPSSVYKRRSLSSSLSGVFYHVHIMVNLHISGGRRSSSCVKCRRHPFHPSNAQDPCTTDVYPVVASTASATCQRAQNLKLIVVGQAVVELLHGERDAGRHVVLLDDGADGGEHVGGYSLDPALGATFTIDATVWRTARMVRGSTPQRRAACATPSAESSAPASNPRSAQDRTYSLWWSASSCGFSLEEPRMQGI